MFDDMLEIFALSDFSDPQAVLGQSLTGRQWGWVDAQSATLELTTEQAAKVTLHTPSTIFSDTHHSQILAEDLTLDGTTYSAGSRVEDAYEAQFSGSDGADYTLVVHAIHSRIIGISFHGTAPAPGICLIYDGPNHSQRHARALPSIVANQMIDTPDGPRSVGELRPGDRVSTLDHGTQIIRWVGGSRLALTADGMENMRPVVIARDAFGAGLPRRKLFVAPQQPVLAPGSDLAQAPDRQDGFVAAEDLLHHDRLWRKRRSREVSYVHLLFDQAVTVISQGLPIECAQPNDSALAALRRANLLPPETEQLDEQTALAA